MEKKLEVKNLRISFRTDAGKVQAVRGIDFDLYKGETLAIVGESGSGKSVTNKAIIGISAANAIIESGEIIYDGQDLIQISEEEFQKLRGDKIAMIFQDPLSALDPINKIGMQMTEAMLLKNKANRKNARITFNFTMAYLLDCMCNAQGITTKDAEGKLLEQKTKDFNTFEVEHLRIEHAYDDAKQSCIDTLEACKDLLFLIEKNAVKDFDLLSKTIIEEGKKSVHVNVCDEDILPYVTEFEELAKTCVSSNLFKKSGEQDYSVLVESLQNIQAACEKALTKDAPNFFTLGYHNIFAEEEKDYSVLLAKFGSNTELNKYLREYLDNHFMLDFIDNAKKGVIYSFNNTIQNKTAFVKRAEEVKELFKTTDVSYKDAKAYAKELGLLCEACKNPLSVIKESITYTFKSSFEKNIITYYEAIPNNKKELTKYEKEMAKYNKIIAKGKTPDYKVTPAKLVDLELAKENIIRRLELIIDSYKNDIDNASRFDADKATVDLIDFFKEQASRVSHVVTKASAKTKAIKLMEEVGIPEPRVRYNQYPFEFSGGMRQRIVIAIALSADPDILICDEPTTALDVTIQSQILELINRIKKERNLSIIFITHDLGVVANMADRIAVMYAGKIVETGTSEDIFYDPRHPYTWALLSSMPDLDTKEKLDAIPGTPPNMIYPPKGDAFAARNKYAMAIDFELQPPMFDVPGSTTHKAATWLLDPRAPKLEMPKAIKERIDRMNKRRQESEGK